MDHASSLCSVNGIVGACGVGEPDSEPNVDLDLDLDLRGKRPQNGQRELEVGPEEKYEGETPVCA